MTVRASTAESGGFKKKDNRRSSKARGKKKKSRVAGGKSERRKRKGPVRKTRPLTTQELEQQASSGRRGGISFPTPREDITSMKKGTVFVRLSALRPRANKRQSKEPSG